MIEVKTYTQLESKAKEQIEGYIYAEFGHIPVVKETEWAAPDWTIMLYVDGEMATFYNIVLRTVLIDGLEIGVAGVNNVITPKKYRGNGYASRLLREAETLIFEDLKCELGLLLCADDLIPFYEKLGWYKVDSLVYFEQPTGRQQWKANTMLLGSNERLDPAEIDLNGLPW